MPVEYIKDSSGKNKSVILPIDEWERVEEFYNQEVNFDPEEELSQEEKKFLDEAIERTDKYPPDQYPERYIDPIAYLEKEIKKMEEEIQEEEKKCTI